MIKGFNYVLRNYSKKTLENLAAAFAGESMARNKYDFYAKKAREEGYGYIADIFEETSYNEHIHAKELYKLLEDGIGTTEENLLGAIEGEKYETEVMYPTFAKEAKEEGETPAYAFFTAVGGVEGDHMERYEKLLELVKTGKVFERDEPVEWKCSKCGWKIDLKVAPLKCSVCMHPQEYFLPGDMVEF